MTDTPAPEMVERVARMAAGNWWAAREHLVTRYSQDDYVDLSWGLFLPDARGYIKAMREPTATMLEAAAPAHEGERLMHKVAYRLMIDAALSETPEAGES
jgi:hypothetical protein